MSEFVRTCLYRPGGTPTQIDHPGFETCVVDSAAALDAKVAAGWSLRMAPAAAPEPEPESQPEPEPEPAPEKPGRRKKSDTAD